MPNVLASIGRSGAVGDFVKEARMLRKQEADIAMDRERLDISRAEGERSERRLGMESEINEERLRSMRFNQQKEQEAYAEANKDVLHNPELWGNKGTNQVAEEWFKSTGKGVITPDGKLTYKKKHVNEFYEELGKNPMLQRSMASADLKSANAMLDKVKAAEEDKQAFQEHKQMIPELTPETLPEIRKFAEEDYLRAVRGFRGITAKAEEEIDVKREAARERTEALKDSAEAKKMMAQAANISANAAMINAGANVTRAGAAVAKTEAEIKSKISDVDKARIAGIDKEKTHINKRLEKAIKDDEEEEVIRAIKTELMSLDVKRNRILNSYNTPNLVKPQNAQTIPSTSYKTPEDVRAAYKSGKLTEEEATNIILGLEK